MNKLAITSLIFITNVVVNFMKEYYIYSLLFLFLLITSIYHHTVNTDLSRTIDKIFVYLVIFYGGYIFFSKDIINIKIKILVIILFLSTAFLYHYGYIYNKYCFDPDSDVSKNYHGLMHIISSIGHHMIIL